MFNALVFIGNLCYNKICYRYFISEHRTFSKINIYEKEGDVKNESH